MKQYLIATDDDWNIYKAESETQAFIDYISDNGGLKDFTLQELEKFVESFGFKKLVTIYNSQAYDEVLYITEIKTLYDNVANHLYHIREKTK